MAKAELDVQTKIIKSVRRDGGYGRKLSNKFLIGIPDLLVCLLPFVPCYCEVKDLGEVTDKFDVKIETTPKQKYEMELMSKAYEHSDFHHPTAFVLVALRWRQEHYLVGVPRDTERLNFQFKDKYAWTIRRTGGYYALKHIMEFLGLMKCRL